MDVIDLNYGGDMIGAIKFAERDEKSANDIFVGNPGDTSQISKVYVDEIKDLGNASDFTFSRLISDGLNSEMGDEDCNEDLSAETNNGSIVAETRQVDLKGENVAGEAGLEDLGKVVGHGTAVSHGDSTVVEEIFEQKEAGVKIKIDCNNTEPASLFVQLPNVGEKVNYVVNLDACGQDEGKVISDDLINNQGTDVIEGCTNWWDSLYIETTTKSSEEEGRNGDFSEVCNDATTKLWENKDKIEFNSGALIPKKRGSENQTEKEGEYFVSDFVWGKVRSHPWWPGQILEPSSASDNVMKYFKKDSYLVAYFGDQTFAWNNASKILPFGLYFQEMEKQSTDETFKIAVDAALDEVSRRVECGLVCGCLPEGVLDRVKCEVVSSAGIQVKCSRIYYCGDGFPAAASFVPAELFAYLKSLAETPKAAVNRLQFTSVRAQLLAFIRWKGCSQFPAIEKFTRSLENDANPMALHEEELFDEVLEVPLAFKKDDAAAVKGNSFTKVTSDMRQHPAAEGQRKKKQRVLETMPAIGSCLSNGENTFQEEFNWDMALASSMKKKRRANGEISLEKVREGHLLPMANNEAASMSKNRIDVGKLRRVTGKLDKRSSFKSSGKHRRQRSTSQECPPVNEMLSKMVIVAENPMETCSLLKSVAGFFVNFRNSICLENNSMLRNEGSTDMFDTEDGSDLVTGETFKLKGTEDLYWTDKIIENDLEDQVFLEHDTQTEKNTLIAEPEGLDVMILQKDERMIQSNLEEPGILESEKATVIAEPQGLDDVNRNKDGDRDTNAMVTTDAETSNAPHIDENSEEYSPTLLILNFNKLQSIPSIKNLNNIFKSYGPLNELDTEILSKSRRAKIVFKRRSDADTAFSSAGKYRTFGPSLISYCLKYLPKTYNAKRRKKNKAPAPAPQSGV